MASDRSSFRPTTANDRFKRAYSRSTSIGITVAVAVHFALFQFSPPLSAADVAPSGPELEVVLPPAVAVPPPPEEIARPARPRVAENVQNRTTIQPPIWNKPERLGPPPVIDETRHGPVWVPRDVEPRLVNGDEVASLLRRLYPSTLREAGIGGTVVLALFVDATGAPGRANVQTSSGYGALDAAALDMIGHMRFSPAQNRDKAVGVWVRQTISFTAD